jgi:hypothetical protein
MSDLKRYQLIKPFSGNKIYESKDLMKGAKKCYQEFKSSNIPANEFVMMDIDTYQKFTFKIHGQTGGRVNPMGNHPMTQTGGHMNQQTSGWSQTDYLIAIDNLEKRVERLELLESSMYQKNSKNDDMCIIL